MVVDRPRSQEGVALQKVARKVTNTMNDPGAESLVGRAGQP